MEDETSSIASSSKPYFGKAHKKPKNNKIPKNEIKKEQNQDSEEENEQATTTTTQPLQNNQPPPEFISFQKTWSEHFIVELTRLPGKMDDTEIEELFKKFNPSACFFYDPDEETKQREARACFADRHVAIKCCTKLHKKRVNSLSKLSKKPNAPGIQISARVLNLDIEKDEKHRLEAKKSRIIVRNLKFTVNEKKLKTTFSHYGTVTDISIPKGEDNKKLGFAFVQFTTRMEAHKAINAFKNLDKKIAGRVVAVDLALAKDKFKKEKEGNKKKGENSDSEDDDDDDMSDDSDNDDENSNSAADSSDEDMEQQTEDEAESSDPESEQYSGDSDLEDIDSSTKNTSKKESKEKDPTIKNNDVSENKTLFIKNLPQDTTQKTLRKLLSKFGKIDFITLLKSNKSGQEAKLSGTGFVKFAEKKCAANVLKDALKEDGIVYKNKKLNVSLAVAREDLKQEQREQKSSEKSKTSEKSQKSSSFDIHQGKTLFIRNIPYDASNQGLAEVFSEHATVNYAICLFNKETETCKGTGFVQLTEKEDIEKITSLAKDGKLSYEGRTLNVSVAVDRESARNFENEGGNGNSSKDNADKRNLFLIKEGQILENTPAAEGVSEHDLNLRKKLLNILKTKLKNGDMFMSKTRLVVHNIPKKLSDKKLQDLIYNTLRKAGEASSGIDIKRLGKIKVTIMRDRKNDNKSMGYAFVNCESDDIALSVLRTFNNNPSAFLQDKRPVVEFCCENRKAINAQNKRQERFKNRQAIEGVKDEKDKKDKNNNKSKNSDKKLKNTSENVQIDNSKLFNYQGSAASKKQKGEKILNTSNKKKKPRWVKDAPDGRIQKQSSATSKEPEAKTTPNTESKKTKKRKSTNNEDSIKPKKSSRKGTNSNEKDDLQFNSIMNKYMEKLQT